MALTPAWAFTPRNLSEPFIFELTDMQVELEEALTRFKYWSGKKHGVFN